MTLAAVLFDTDGYHQSTMEDLAEKAGIAKPTLYHYFKSKEDILFEIHQVFVQHLIDRHDARLRSRLSPVQLLLECMVDILELMETHRGHVRVFFEHYRELSDDRRSVVLEQRQQWRRRIEDVVQAGIDQGELREVDVNLTTLAILGMSNWAYQWYRPEQPKRPREIAQFFWELLVVGVAADDHPLRSPNWPAIPSQSSPDRDVSTAAS